MLLVVISVRFFVAVHHLWFSFLPNCVITLLLIQIRYVTCTFMCMLLWYVCFTHIMPVSLWIFSQLCWLVALISLCWCILSRTCRDRLCAHVLVVLTCWGWCVCGFICIRFPYSTYFLFGLILLQFIVWWPTVSKANRYRVWIRNPYESYIHLLY